MIPNYLEVEHGSDRYRETLEIRDRILRAPLGLRFDESEIAAESSDLHLVAADSGNDEIIACLVLSPKGPGIVHMRQVAVIESRRGEGIGKALVAFSEQSARDRGFTIMKLHAREPVVPFYEKLGYEVVGETFLEVTIPHREMRKQL